ncbi:MULTISPECIES: hypothetical protein [Bacillus amyloliquefaciens group]|uniref:hypothetical protein n=1 Tax=Bacillus amyloliquefaciens group TaxID=1938374 RepID=UPI00226F50D3|nr:hypothetical protein [Bacillus velezensis]MCY0089190.1 hypothetical protein [Bacillus velezensis]MDH3075771.1 hypothetical protein [Bacillus velezensis]MDH3107113.1 hypothetical protein [Bacillus velezensis]MDH3135708.1 hypothetical protein [Bacillus velezensis]
MIDMEFFITGEPISTELGECRFIKVKEYGQLANYLRLIKMSKKEIIYVYSKEDVNRFGELDELVAELKKMTLYEISGTLPNFQEAYSTVLSKMFDGKEILDKLTPDNFDSIRELVLKMCCLKEEKISSNPEIQKANERSKRVKSQDVDQVDIADIISTVSTYTGYLYKDINDMTLFQLYMTYHRIAQFKQYDTSTLFATVSPEAGKNIVNWDKHIDLFEEEKHYISRDKFMNETKGFSKGS